MLKLVSLTCVAVLAASGCSGPAKVAAEPEVAAPSSPEAASQAAPAAADPVAEFGTACREGLAKAKAELAPLLAVNGPRTAENTLEPYNQMALELSRSAGEAELMSEVHPDASIRDEARGCGQDVEAFVSALALNTELYAAIAALDVNVLDGEERRVVERLLQNFRRAGVDKDAATRARLQELDEQLTVLGQQFGKNIAEDQRAIELDSVDDLAGLPADYIASHPPDERGIIRITTDYPDIRPFMAYAESDEHRKALYIQFKSRGAGTNEEVLRQMLSLRAEKATLLGYDNWADYATEDKMIGSGKAAAAFVEKVVAVAKRRAKKDYRELLQHKRELEPKAERVEDWERSYLENLVKTDRYQFNPQAVRPYFEYQQTLEGLLAITSKIYDIEYRPLTNAEADVWHEDVVAYDVTRDDVVIGRIYLDMHPREGKFKHAAQFPYRQGALGQQLPVGVLVCNFANPRTSSGPALLEHDQVTTMFHEFGHLMHHVLGGQQKWVDLSGVSTEWDFVEAPSQMFEEWAWNHDTLALFAKHHATGEPIPAELVERMRAAHEFGLGIETLQQIFYTLVSLRFHQLDPKELDMDREMVRLQAKYTPFRYVPGTTFYASFGHLNDYSALYYTYLWSKVIARDMLTPFIEHGLMNLEWTHRYRDQVLAAGGREDAAVLVEKFLGRPYSFAAFKAYLGG